MTKHLQMRLVKGFSGLYVLMNESGPALVIKLL